MNQLLSRIIHQLAYFRRLIFSKRIHIRINKSSDELEIESRIFRTRFHRMLEFLLLFDNTDIESLFHSINEYDVFSQKNDGVKVFLAFEHLKLN